MEQEAKHPSEDELMAREDKCRKSIQTVAKAIFMRLFVTGLLIWAVLRSDMQPWVIGMIVFVMILNLAGLLPLGAELKKRRRELKEIMEQYE